MKLLELLVKELPKNGGWPEDVWHVTQDSDGQVNGYGYSKPYRNTNDWNSEGFIRYLLGGESKPLSANWRSSVITREQYEAAIAAQQPVWNGEGLPTTGIKCEWQDYKTKKWITVRVVYSSEWITIISEDKDDDAVELAIENYGEKGRRKFRPVRTEAERKREEVAESLIRFLDSKTDIDNVFRTLDVMEFIDYVAAGKIPGVELSK